MSDHQTSSSAVLDRPRGGELRRVPLSKIVVREGHNPREAIDRDGDDFKSLVASVRAHGVLTPLRLTELDDETFELVAGERRYWAAMEASCIDVPAYVRVPAADRDDEKVKIASEALAENDHRVGLNAIERARVYKRLRDRMTVKGIAQDVGRTQKHVKDTLALLDLPESLQAMVADGSLPLNVAPKLLELGKVHREFPELMVAEVVDDREITWTDLREDPVAVLSDCANLPDDVYRVEESYPVEDFELTDKAKRDVAAIERLSSGPAGWITFTASDVEKADALGAVCRSDARGWATLIVGADVAAQLVCDKLAARAKDLRRIARDRRRQETASQSEAGRASDAPPSGSDQDDGPDAGRSAPSPDPEAEERRREEEARQERERLEAERAAAVAYNERLGTLLANALSNVKLDARALKILGATPIAHQLRDVASRGARYGFPNWVTIETKAGKEKRRYLDPKDAEAKAIEYLAGAKKPGEVVGRQLALLLMAVFADQRCIARSYRVPWKPTAYDGPWTAEAGELIDDLAAEHLPAELVKDQLAERAAAREAARARDAAEQTAWDMLKQVDELDADGLSELDAAIEVAWTGWTWERDRAQSAVRARRKELQGQEAQPETDDTRPESEGGAEGQESQTPDDGQETETPDGAQDSPALPAAA